MKELIKALQNEVEFNNHKLNIPYMILPIQEALDNDDENLLEVINQHYKFNYYYEYELHKKLIQKIEIFIFEEEGVMDSQKDYYYIIEFGKNANYDGWDFPSFTLSKIYDTCFYVTNKNEYLVEEFVKNFNLNSENDEIRKKAERLEELENEMKRIKMEIVKIKSGD